MYREQRLGKNESSLPLPPKGFDFNLRRMFSLIAIVVVIYMYVCVCIIHRNIIASFDCQTSQVAQVPLNLEVKFEDAWLQVGKINQLCLSQWQLQKYRPLTAR